MNSIVPSNNSVSAKQAFPFEQEIIQWDLESAINRCAENFHSFQKSAALLAKDLYIAHEVLAVRGGNRRTEEAPEFTWTDFCDAVGISRKTAMLWMRLYDPVNDRVRTPEELAKEAQEVKQEILSRIEAVEDEIGLLEDAIDSALCVYDYTDEESDELCRLLNKLDNYFKFEG